MESNAFFKSIDRVAQYFFLFNDMNPVRSDNASEVDTSFLKPYWDCSSPCYLMICSPSKSFSDFQIFCTAVYPCPWVLDIFNYFQI